MQKSAGQLRSLSEYSFDTGCRSQRWQKMYLKPPSLGYCVKCLAHLRDQIARWQHNKCA